MILQNLTDPQSAKLNEMPTYPFKKEGDIYLNRPVPNKVSRVPSAVAKATLDCREPKLTQVRNTYANNNEQSRVLASVFVSIRKTFGSLRLATL